MKLFLSFLSCSFASPISVPTIIGGKDAVDGQFPHQGMTHYYSLPMSHRL